MSVAETLGWVGSAVVVASYAQQNARRLRILSIAASVFLISYALMIGVWSNVVLEGVLVAINLRRLRVVALESRV